jgi:hypothetical protein
MSCSRRRSHGNLSPDPDRVCAAMASSSSALFRERRHIGAVTWQTPKRQTPRWVAERCASVRQKYRITASCSPIQRDVKPVGADSRRFPLSDPYPLLITANAGTYDRLCSPLQSCSSSGSRYHRNLHQDEFGPTRTEPGCKRCGNAPSPDPSAIRNSLQIPCSFLKIPC